MKHGAVCVRVEERLRNAFDTGARSLALKRQSAPCYLVFRIAASNGAIVIAGKGEARTSRGSMRKTTSVEIYVALERTLSS